MKENIVCTITYSIVCKIRNGVIINYNNIIFLHILLQESMAVLSRFTQSIPRHCFIR